MVDSGPVVQEKPRLLVLSTSGDVTAICAFRFVIFITPTTRRISM